MRFETGQTVVRRYINSDRRIGMVVCAQVVAHDDRGLLTWVASGSTVARRTALDGRLIRKMPLAEKLRTATMLTPGVWEGPGVLMFTPTDAAHSVWWFFDQQQRFRGWYVNLETPCRFWHGGLDTVDQALDVWAEPDRSWRWKDEDEFAERTGVPGFWTADEAEQIRAEGERAVKLVEAEAFPFDGTWCDFAPDPSWRPVGLPWYWDQVPAATHYDG